MNLFGKITQDVTTSYCASRGLPQPQNYDPDESPDDIAFNALIDEYREDLLGELRHQSLAEVITQEYELHETGLLSRLLVANAAWDGKDETAAARLHVIDRLIYLAMDQIAQKRARKDLDL